MSLRPTLLPPRFWHWMSVSDLAPDHDAVLDAQPDVLVPVVVGAGEAIRRACRGGHEVRQPDDLRVRLDPVVEEHLGLRRIERAVDDAEVDVVGADERYERGDHAVAGLLRVGHGRVGHRRAPGHGELKAERLAGVGIERLLRLRHPVLVAGGRVADELRADDLPGGDLARGADLDGDRRLAGWGDDPMVVGDGFAGRVRGARSRSRPRWQWRWRPARTPRSPSGWWTTPPRPWPGRRCRRRGPARPPAARATHLVRQGGGRAPDRSGASRRRGRRGCRRPRRCCGREPGPSRLRGPSRRSPGRSAAGRPRRRTGGATSGRRCGVWRRPRSVRP